MDELSAIKAVSLYEPVWCPRAGRAGSPCSHSLGSLWEEIPPTQHTHNDNIAAYYNAMEHVAIKQIPTPFPRGEMGTWVGIEPPACEGCI